jgi:hypothetical protein
MWPAGIPSEPNGTVTWAGGLINWNDPDYTAAGHFYALVSGVNITCHDPAQASAPAGTISYVYGKNSSADTPSVALSNATTINGAAGVVVGVKDGWGIWTTVGCAIAFSMLGAVLA